MLTKPKNCLNCGKPMDKYKRKDAKYCGDPCRKAFFEKKGKVTLLGANSLDKNDLKPSCLGYKGVFASG